MASELHKFRKEFDEIADTLYHTHHGLPIKSNRKWIRAFARDLRSIRRTWLPEFDMTQADAHQEVALIWLELIEKFHIKKPRVHIRTWLVRMSCWRVRDWYEQQCRIVTEVPTWYYDTVKIEPEFRLDLSFLLIGTNYFPLSELSPYERYLVFLKYKEGRNTLEIAEAVQKCRHTVGIHLRNITNKMRRLRNATDDTRRSCETGPGVPTGTDNGESCSAGDPDAT